MRIHNDRHISVITTNHEEEGKSRQYSWEIGSQEWVFWSCKCYWAPSLKELSRNQFFSIYLQNFFSLAMLYLFSYFQDPLSLSLSLCVYIYIYISKICISDGYYIKSVSHFQFRVCDTVRRYRERMEKLECPFEHFCFFIAIKVW